MLSQGHDVTLTFKGEDAHATSEAFLGNLSLSLLAAKGPSKWDAERTPLVAEHPGLSSSVIAWGVHGSKKPVRRSGRIAEMAAAQRQAVLAALAH